LQVFRSSEHNFWLRNALPLYHTWFFKTVRSRFFLAVITERVATVAGVEAEVATRELLVPFAANTTVYVVSD
jgi:hypothetical protein